MSSAAKCYEVYVKYTWSAVEDEDETRWWPVSIWWSSVSGMKADVWNCLVYGKGENRTERMWGMVVGDSSALQVTVDK